jgi:hypothetical protein
MTNSNVSNAAFKPGEDFAYPHSIVDGKLQAIPFVTTDNAGPAGSINSSAADMAKWVMLQLNHGKLPDRDTRLFSEAQSREMWSPQTILPISDPLAPLAALKANFADYALGWMVRDYHGQKLVTHTGGVAGFVSRVMLVPEQNLGIVILTNAEQGGAFDSILYHVLDHYFGLSSTDWIVAFKAARDQKLKDATDTEQRQSTQRNTNSHLSLPLEKYAGTYEDAWYGPTTIRMENGKLVLSFDHTPAMVGEMEPWQYDTFRTHWRDHVIADAFVTFSLKSDGSIEQFKMVPVSPLTDFSFDYQDLEFHPMAKTGTQK